MLSKHTRKVLLNELAALHRKREQHETALRRLEKEISGIEQLVGPGENGKSGRVTWAGKRTWAERITGVLQDGPLRIREIVARLDATGVRSPGKSPLATIVAAEAARMARGPSPRLQKTGPGRYKIAER